MTRLCTQNNRVVRGKRLETCKVPLSRAPSRPILRLFFVAAVEHRAPRHDSLPLHRENRFFNVGDTYGFSEHRGPNRARRRTMSANNVQALFACSRCFSRHPFEELSPGQQLCKVSPFGFPCFSPARISLRTTTDLPPRASLFVLARQRPNNRTFQVERAPCAQSMPLRNHGNSKRSAARDICPVNSRANMYLLTLEAPILIRAWCLPKDV